MKHGMSDMKIVGVNNLMKSRVDVIFANEEPKKRQKGIGIPIGWINKIMETTYQIERRKIRTWKRVALGARIVFGLLSLQGLFDVLNHKWSFAVADALVAVAQLVVIRLANSEIYKQ